MFKIYIFIKDQIYNYLFTLGLQLIDSWCESLVVVKFSKHSSPLLLFFISIAFWLFMTIKEIPNRKLAETKSTDIKIRARKKMQMLKVGLVHRVLFTISYLHISTQLLQYAVPPVEIPCLLPNFLSIDISQRVWILLLCSLSIYLCCGVDSCTFDCNETSWISPRTPHTCNMRNKIKSSSFFPFFFFFQLIDLLKRLYYLLII